MNISSLNNPAFLLSIAILNLDIQSPVLFLHLLINPDTKMITGSAELSIPKDESTGTQIMDITGGYQTLLNQQNESFHHVNLTGMSSYDQSPSAIPITMVINQEWKKGTASYKYMQNDEWIIMNNVYLKIKMAQPYVIPTSVLDIQQGPYLPGQIKQQI